MTIIQLGILLVVTVSFGLAQEPMPKSVCKFDRTRVTFRRIKVPVHYSFDLNPDLHSLNVSPGTEVAVSGQQNGWSCVTANVRTSHGQEVQSGWIESSRLESLQDATATSQKK